MTGSSRNVEGLLLAPWADLQCAASVPECWFLEFLTACTAAAGEAQSGRSPAASRSVRLEPEVDRSPAREEDGEVRGSSEPQEPAGIVGDPVEDLTAARRGADVQLSWAWPEAATDASVVVCAGGQTLPTREISRAAYQRERGVWCMVGPVPCQAKVTAITSIADGRQL